MRDSVKKLFRFVIVYKDEHNMVLEILSKIVSSKTKGIFILRAFGISEASGLTRSIGNIGGDRCEQFV